jgi:DNA-binding response OmpR family regulator
MRVLLIQKPSPRFKRALDEQGHIVQVARDAAEADHKAKDEGCNLVILDLALLGADGLALVRKWRTDGLNAHVLVLAPRGAATRKAEALDAGADVLLAEPYDQEEVLAQIRALCRRAPQNRGPIQRVFDLEIDGSLRTVRRASRVIKLTRSEFEMLQFLLCHRGRVVSRSMIWQQVYGEEGEITSNVIDVCIHNLRNKIDRGFDMPLILTHWGQGYMVREEPQPENLGQ